MDREKIMSVVPKDYFRNWYEELDRFHRQMEERFKNLSTRDEFPSLPTMPCLPDINKSMIGAVNQTWVNMMNQLEHQVPGQATVERDQDKFRVIVDVQQFAPEEVNVRTDDKYITVEGKHEEKQDRHGYVSRHFVRRYELPQGYDIGHVRPSLSSDGILTITAPRLVLPAPGERIVPIQQSRAPAINSM